MKIVYNNSSQDIYCFYKLTVVNTEN